MTKTLAPLALLAISLTACGEDSVPDEQAIAVSTPTVSFTPDDELVRAATSTAPVTVSYRVIGTPVVGQPVAVDLQFDSPEGGESFNVNYRINDATSMELPESQPAQVSVAAPAAGQPAAQQVTVVPLREGRLYLNVAVVIENDNGSTQHITAVPIQVDRASAPGAGATALDDDAG